MYANFRPAPRRATIVTLFLFYQFTVKLRVVFSFILFHRVKGKRNIIDVSWRLLRCSQWRKGNKFAKKKQRSRFLVAKFADLSKLRRWKYIEFNLNSMCLCWTSVVTYILIISINFLSTVSMFFQSRETSVKNSNFVWNTKNVTVAFSFRRSY